MNISKRYTYFLAAMVTALLILPSQIYAAVSSSVSSQIIASGQPFQFTVTTNQGTSNTPDISNLNQDFMILGQSSGQSVSIINGQMSKTRQWSYTLQAKQTLSKKDTPVKLMIPSVTLGNEATRPITVTLTPPQSSFKYDKDSIQISSSLSSSTVHVQQQLELTVRIMMSPQMARLIQGAALSPISIPDVTVKELGQPNTTEEMINNKPYVVSEKTYVLYPQKSGTFTIPSQTFVMEIIDPNQKQQDPFSRFGFGSSMFQSTKQLRLTTDSHTVTVSSIPANYKGPWIPATKVIANQAFNTPNQNGNYETGDIIKRQITIDAENLLGNQLPDLSNQFSVKGLSTYPKPGDFSSYDQNGVVVGQRIENIEYVANNPGNYTFPEVKLNWWNTSTNTIETVVLPQKTITVTGEALTPPAKVVKEPAAMQDQNTDTPKLNDQSTSKIAYTYYVGLALVILVLILILIWTIYRYRKKQHLKISTKHTTSLDQTKRTLTEPTIDDKQLIKKLKQSLNANNPNDIRKALTACATAIYPNLNSTLSAYQSLLKHLPASTQKALQNLEANKYGSQQDQENNKLKSEQVAEIINNIQKIMQQKAAEKQSPIPRLYPQ